MVLIQFICLSGNPVTVGMSIHISSIDQISEVNMVSLERKKKNQTLINCSSIFLLRCTSKTINPWSHPRSQGVLLPLPSTIDLLCSWEVVGGRVTLVWC